MEDIIQVYIPNMKDRIERRESIIHQFSDKRLFNLNLVVPEEHTIPATSLWRTFIKITETENKKGSNYFVFCEDDHIFTKNYSDESLLKSIKEANSLGADIISGGFSWYDMPIQITDHLFWVKRFNGMQFTVIFNKFYPVILNSDTVGNKTLDWYLSTLTDDIFVMSPYISVQKEFGYSDVTKKNNEEGYVTGCFDRCNSVLNILRKVKFKYEELGRNE